jgi:hypothetical protein
VELEERNILEVKAEVLRVASLLRHAKFEGRPVDTNLEAMASSAVKMFGNICREGDIKSGMAEVAWFGDHKPFVAGLMFCYAAAGEYDKAYSVFALYRLTYRFPPDVVEAGWSYLLRVKDPTTMVKRYEELKANGQLYVCTSYETNYLTTVVSACDKIGRRELAEEIRASLSAGGGEQKNGKPEPEKPVGKPESGKIRVIGDKETESESASGIRESPDNQLESGRISNS